MIRGKFDFLLLVSIESSVKTNFRSVYFFWWSVCRGTRRTNPLGVCRVSQRLLLENISPGASASRRHLHFARTLACSTSACSALQVRGDWVYSPVLGLGPNDLSARSTNSFIANGASASLLAGTDPQGIKLESTWTATSNRPAYLPASYGYSHPCWPYPSIPEPTFLMLHRSGVCGYPEKAEPTI